MWTVNAMREALFIAALCMCGAFFSGTIALFLALCFRTTRRFGEKRP